MRLIALILMLIAPSWAVAKKYVKDMTFSDVGIIFVELTDGAKGGCWTNLIEVKTYASNKIELAGGKLTDEMNDVIGQGVIFSMQVNGDRHEQTGLCFGAINISTKSVGSAIHLPNSYGWVAYSDYGYYLIHPDNFNTEVLDNVKSALDEWQ